MSNVIKIFSQTIKCLRKKGKTIPPLACTQQACGIEERRRLGGLSPPVMFGQNITVGCHHDVSINTQSPPNNFLQVYSLVFGRAWQELKALVQKVVSSKLSICQKTDIILNK